MRFRNYCIMIMGNTNGVMDEISKVSENILGKLDAKGVIIVTFTSFANVGELKDFFKFNERNFFLFLLDDSVSGYNILRKDINYELFGKLPISNIENINKTIELLGDSDIKKEHNIISVTEIIDNPVKDIFDNINLEELTPDEKQNILNDIIDKGVKNLTKRDKEILKKISIKKK